MRAASILLIALMILLLSLTHEARAASSPTANPWVLSSAKAWFHRFQTGKIDRSRLDAQTNQELSDAMIRQEEVVLTKFGKPVKFTFESSEEVADGITGYDFVVTFHSKTIIEESIAFDPGGLLAGIDFRVMVPR